MSSGVGLQWAVLQQNQRTENKEKTHRCLERIRYTSCSLNLEKDGEKHQNLPSLGKILCCPKEKGETSSSYALNK